jgi:glycogen operon protein
MIFNPYWEALEFELPPAGESPASAWHRWIDTSLNSPDDICEGARAPALSGVSYRAQPRSVVVLFARLLNEAG